MRLPGATPRIRWYARRLTSMSVQEIAWRAAQQRRRVLLGVAHDVPTRLTPGNDWESALEAFRRGAHRPVLLDRTRAATIAETRPEAVEALVRAAERVTAGRVAYFGYPEVQVGEPIDWNYDPLHRFRWPTRPGAKINHRFAAADPKWIWELNRLQHLPWLAQAWLFTGRDSFAEAALEQLDSWVDQNPVGRGIAWRGAYEPAMRAISVVTALQGLRDHPALTVSRFERVVRVLAASAVQCWRDPSLFSSANNHLVGELAGVTAVSMMVPELARAARWEERALQRLSAEADRQILPDGVGAEQALAYQLLTADLLVLVAALAGSRDGHAPSPIMAALNRSADYLCAVVGEGDPDPRYGDDDDGFALRLDAGCRRTVRDHLGAVAALMGHEGARRCGNDTLLSAWLQTAVGPPHAKPPGEAQVTRFEDSCYAASGGMVVLRSANRRLMMDVGPLGYLSIAAHGHADALAVTLSLDGEDLVGDPGTGSYYGHPEWRGVHRGTRAHATVTVDDQDQSRMAGDFMWTDHARVRVGVVDLRQGVVDAEHDGYHRLDPPVTHRRVLVAPGDWPSILVLDLLHGAGRHHVRVGWPLHPSLDVEPTSDGHVALRVGTPALRLQHAVATPGRGAGDVLEHEAVRGDEESQRGWWSTRLESRVPAALLSSTWHGSLPVAVATLLTTDPTAAPEHLALEWDEGGLTASWTTETDEFEVVADPSGAHQPRLSHSAR